MSERPSEPLLRILRDAAKDRGVNTAALARSAEVSRSELKQVMAGSSPLTVDLLIRLSDALSLSEVDFHTMLTNEAREPATAPLQSASTAGIEPVLPVDPYGIHAEQILRLGFALGCDMHLVLALDGLNDTGVPDAVVSRFPDGIPLRLDATFHSHNDPHFLPAAIRLVLSFGALYTCTLPWAVFRQITLIPVPEPALVADPPPQTMPSGHLRLVADPSEEEAP